MDHYIIVLLCTGFLTLLYTGLSDSGYQIPSVSVFLAFALMVYCIIVIGSEPIYIFGDKYNYANSFQHISPETISKGKDKGWAYYTLFVRRMTSNEDFYFYLTTLIYVAAYYLFALRFISSKFIFYFLLATFSSFGFFSYGVNTIRAGFSLALLLMAFSAYKKFPLFVILAVFSVLCHKSMAIPLAAFVITRFYNKSQLFLYVWAIAFVMSAANIGAVSTFIQSNIGGFDDRGLDYLKGKSTGYKTGFRIDFVIYSLIPIVVGYYYVFKLKVKDVIYIRLYNSYILSNSIWLLVIRMNFTDRMAYLSWFLIPFILLYPILKYKLPINQRKYLNITIAGILLFTSYMYFK